MTPFLQDIARYVYDTFRQDLPEVCLVFPNRRAGLFFDHYLAGIIDRPVLKPAVLTINDFMKELSGLRLADDLELIFELYRIYMKEKKRQETFDEFYQWGEILLADFDDVDKYMVDASGLFSNMASLKEMDRKFDYLTDEQVKIIQRFWKSFSPDHPGPQQERFIRVWEVLYTVYAGLQKNLLQKGMGYEGLVYRRVAERIRAGDLPPLPGKKIVLAGFNALNTCEEVLFRYLKKTGSGVFLWDYDEYYLKDDMQEAGNFIRKYLKEFPPPQMNPEFRNIENGAKDIHIYSVPSDVGQASLVTDILQQLPEDPGGTFHDTAVVLADEHLLIPVLYALPEKISSINVTMGYPVNQTPVNSFIELIFRLHRNSRVINGTIRYYFRDILGLISHQVLKDLFPEDSKRLSNTIISENLVFIAADRLHLNELLRELFPVQVAPENFPASLMVILEKITGNTRASGATIRSFDLEFVCHIYLRLKRLNDILVTNKAALSIDTFSRLYRQSIGSSRVPFIGEPLSGIQVMGVLETRLLDFKNVIMLSMNEGYFPKTSASPSFIPHYLRYAFGMPTMEHQDNIYAYYFYRLLQRAGTISLMYNNSTEGMHKGERSRYICQLQFDPLIRTGQKTVGLDVHTGHPPPLVISKNRRIMEKLAGFHTDDQEAYLSPSALNTYMECSLRFFLRHVAGIREADTIEEEIDSPAFGNILHAAITGLYESVPGRIINEQDLHLLLQSEPQIREYIDKAFRDHFPAGDGPGERPDPGTNILIREVLFEYVKNILREDLKHVPMILIEQEQLHLIIIPVNTPEGSRPVRVGGRIDRVDSTAGFTRIIDYKTGIASQDFISTDQLFTRNDRDRNRAAFQVLLYSRMFQADQPGHDQLLVPGLYIVPKMHEGSYEYKLKMGEKNKSKKILESFLEIRDEFEKGMIELLKELYDVSVPFRQTEDERSCRYCPYSGICYRTSKDD